jgi:hypothetical protein
MKDVNTDEQTSEQANERTRERENEKWNGHLDFFFKRNIQPYPQTYIHNHTHLAICEYVIVFGSHAIDKIVKFVSLFALSHHACAPAIAESRVGGVGLKCG